MSGKVDINETMTLKELLRILIAFDNTHGNYPEHGFEGLAVADFIAGYFLYRDNFFTDIAIESNNSDDKQQKKIWDEFLNSFFEDKQDCEDITK